MDRHGLRMLRVKSLTKRARRQAKECGWPGREFNPRSIRASLWSRTWPTGHPRPAGKLWTGPARLSKASRLMSNKWRAISMARVLVQESTHASMSRNNP